MSLMPAREAAEIAAMLAAGEPVLRCTSPGLSGEQPSRVPLRVTGWAADRDGIAAVRVALDGGEALAAVHGLPQPELRGALGDEHAASAGFAIGIPPEQCPPGRHELTIEAVTGDGRTVALGGVVDLLPQGPAKRGPDGGIAPPPTISTDTERAALGAAEPFVPRVHREHGVSPERRARYGWAAELAAGRSVLDAGCGAGWGTSLLATRAARAVGVDVAPPLIAAAQRDHGVGAEFSASDLRNLPFGDGAFDVVVCFETIERVPEPDRALGELRRVLKQDGLLLISAVNRGVYPPGNPLHLHEMTSGELATAVGRHFARVAVHRQQTYLATLLADETALAGEDPALALTGGVAKTATTPTGAELYAVVAASDGELPPPPARLVLGTDVDAGEPRRLLESWQRRAIAAELEATALRAEIAWVRQQQEAALWRASRE
jgi:2-polyprenyl-3-methyl-5-hydroxy-6-metoxy-1,4-benzoquinol methylase